MPREYDDDDDLPQIRKKSLTGMDKFFADTSTVALVLFGLCCGLIALIVSIIGVSTCTDEKAKANAKLVLTISIISMVVGVVLNVISTMMSTTIR